MKLDRTMQHNLAIAKLVDLFADPAAHLDARGMILYANEPWQEKLGAVNAKHPGYIRNLVDSSDHGRLEYVLDDPSFNARQIVLRGQQGANLCISQLVAEKGKVRGLVCQQIEARAAPKTLMGYDVGDESSLLSKRLELAVTASGIGVWEYNGDTNRVTWDRHMKIMYGFPADTSTLPEDIWEKSIHPEDRHKTLSATDSANMANRDFDIDFRVVRPDGAVRHLRSRGSQFVDQNGVGRIIGVNWDITQDIQRAQELLEARDLANRQNIALEQARAEMEHRSNHDALTGLANRRYLDQVTTAAMDGNGETSGRLALLHIDLDRFKQINDTLGHGAGDDVLKHVAQFLTQIAPADSLVARIGGDEFAIFIENAEPDLELQKLADKLIGTARKPFVRANQTCRFGLSIGIATRDGPQDDCTRLFVDADIALYRAKNKGRGRCCFFTADLRTALIKKQQCADDILAGLDRAEFCCVYQPQFCAKTLQISGLEVLVRWQHPKRGLLTPIEFLDTAEELGVVNRLDQIVLERALADVAIWQNQGLIVPRISVNVSARRLRDPALPAWISHLGERAKNISFELLESIFLDDSDALLSKNLQAIRDLGISIEVDDFGTGHASVVGLLNLRPDRLKIDRQLIRPILESERQRLLVKSIVEIGKVQGIGVVAEGVETAAHIDVLRDLGCDFLQGYGLCRPVPAAEIQGLLAVAKATGNVYNGVCPKQQTS